MAKLRALRGRKVATIQKGEAVAVESGHVRARAFRIDLDKRVMQVTYRVGAIADDGTFVHDTDYPDLTLQVNGRGDKRELWRQTMENRTSFDLNELSQLASANPKINSLARVFWNVDLNDVEEDT